MSASPIDPALVQLFVALVQAAPALAQGILGVLSPPAAEAVRAELARARGALDAAPLAVPATEAVIARYQARPAPARISVHHAAVLRRLAAPTSSALLSHEERHALAELAAHVDLVTADTDIPPVLRAPEGAWSEPTTHED